METASLNLAHAHARNASAETQSHNVAVAQEEHESAAKEFANATSSVDDFEALRILTLLEQHHHRLAQIIQQQTAVKDAKKNEEGDEDTRAADAGDADAKKADDDAAAPDTEVAAPATAVKQADPASEAQSNPQPKKPVSSSTTTRRNQANIASNLATARGIPSAQNRRGSPVSPTVTAQTAGGKVLGRDARTGAPDSPSSLRNVSSRADVPAATSAHAAVKAESASARAAKGASNADEPFNRFYSTFENLFSAISAPLAFAGLPLMGEDPPPRPHSPAQTTQKQLSGSIRNRRKQQTPSSDTRGSNNNNTANAGDDITSLFSKAALRALRDGPNSHQFSANGPAESFYVVPSTGHTVSYANILSRDNSGAGAGLRSSADGTRPNLATDSTGTDPDLDDLFVDASETPQAPGSPSHQRGGSGTAQHRHPRRSQKGTGKSGKNPEELELENAMFRQLLDAQSRRLQLWEASSQSQTQALAASLRARAPSSAQPQPQQQSPHAHPPPPLLSALSSGLDKTSEGEGERALEERIRELERVVEEERQGRETERKEGERLRRENEKLVGVVGRYRERWKNLVEGAKRLRGEGERGNGEKTSVVGGEDAGAGFDG